MADEKTLTQQAKPAPVKHLTTEEDLLARQRESEKRALEANPKAVVDPTYNPLKSADEISRDRNLYENHPSPVDPNKVKPGPGPLEGSPNPSDPTKLFNPNNPNSPVTGSHNPSNPANSPAMQSDKPVSETASIDTLTFKMKAAKADPALVKEKEETLKKISDILNKYNGNESEVPASNEYWQLVGKYRTL